MRPWRRLWSNVRNSPRMTHSTCAWTRGMTILRVVEPSARHGYRPHIRRIGEEKLDGSGRKRYPARRWVVERTLAWLSKCRAVLVRYDKKASNYIGLLQLACATPVVPSPMATCHFEIVSKCASCLPSNLRLCPGRGRSMSALSSPSCTYRVRTRPTVDALINSPLAMSRSIRPSSAFSNTSARLTYGPKSPHDSLSARGVSVQTRSTPPCT